MKKVFTSQRIERKNRHTQINDHFTFCSIERKKKWGLFSLPRKFRFKLNVNGLKKTDTTTSNWSTKQRHALHYLKEENNGAQQSEGDLSISPIDIAIFLFQFSISVYEPRPFYRYFCFTTAFGDAFRGIAYNKISTCSRDVHRQASTRTQHTMYLYYIALHCKTMHFIHNATHFIWLSLLVQYQHSSNILQFLKCEMFENSVDYKERKTKAKTFSVLLFSMR